MVDVQTGSEWLVDASGCDARRLGDVDSLKKLFAAVVHDLGLHPVGEAQWKKFPPPGGVTGMMLLRESHLAIHTFPEHGFAAVNLYCCKPRERWNWEEKLPGLLGAKGVFVRHLPRGVAPASAVPAAGVKNQP